MTRVYVNHTFIEVTPDNRTNMANYSEIQWYNAIHHCHGLW